MKLMTYNWYKKKLNEDNSFDPTMGSGGQPPMGDMAGQVPQTPNVANPAPQQMPNPGDDPSKTGQMPDVTMDPHAPDMPYEDEDMDFEEWKNSYFKESIKGDNDKLLDMIHQIRDNDLDSYPYKFVEDNLQICFLRQYANIDKASKEIRKLIKQELDQNNPATSLVNHLSNILAQMPELNNVFIKLKGLLGLKGDAHRKFIASLLGAVQVGTGGNNEDIIYNERDYSIRISTRFNDKWGMVELGKWALREDDPARYLTEPEQKRLEEGSPEERDILRRRVVIESIAEQFKQRAFIVNVVGKKGTIYTLGWDLAGSLKAAYTQGKLVVRTSQAENSDAMITDDGEIVPYVDMKVKYVKETGSIDETGNPQKEEHDFLKRVDGSLFLNAQFAILREASTSFQGIVLKEVPYTGNPSDLRVIMRCVPSQIEFLFRQC